MATVSDINDLIFLDELISGIEIEQNNFKKVSLKIFFSVFMTKIKITSKKCPLNLEI